MQIDRFFLVELERERSAFASALLENIKDDANLGFLLKFERLQNRLDALEAFAEKAIEAGVK